MHAEAAPFVIFPRVLEGVSRKLLLCQVKELKINQLTDTSPEALMETV